MQLTHNYDTFIVVIICTGRGDVPIWRYRDAMTDVRTGGGICHHNTGV